MKILLTGGGTGGHFYPIIAVAEGINEVTKEKHLADIELYYMADAPYNEGLLYDKGITFKKISAGKVRRYFSFLNISDLFKTGWGTMSAFFQLFSLYPDVVFGKGGYVSFPALFAARLLRIPVVIHESDSKPGKVNLWAGKFAKRIAISYPEAAQYFPKDRVAFTGCPIREEVRLPLTRGAFEFLNFEPSIPTIFVVGGSQGAKLINDIILDALPELVQNYQIIHQTGKKNFLEVKGTAEVVLKDSKFKNRYKPLEYLNDLAYRMAGGASKIVISRAGSTIFELALWGKPSIIIPIDPSVSHDQTSNAFSYARSGACVVIEEKNLAPHILISEINRITGDEALLAHMSESAKNFAQPNAAVEIAREIIHLGLQHEK